MERLNSIKKFVTQPLSSDEKNCDQLNVSSESLEQLCSTVWPALVTISGMHS